MSNSIHLGRGQQLELPVAADHPLAPYQSLRLPTREEILKHPIYKSIVDSRIRNLQDTVFARQGFAGAVSPQAITGVVQGVIWRIGPLWSYQLGNITVESHAVLSYHGNYHVVLAGNVTIEEGGTIRVYCDDPTISATLSLECTQLTGPTKVAATKAVTNLG